MSQGTAAYNIIQSPTGIVTSVGNSTSTPLIAFGAFSGTFEDISAYQEVSISGADQPTGYPGTLMVSFSDDGITPLAPIFLNLDVGGPAFATQYVRVTHKFIKIDYQNGAVPQTAFILTTVYHYTSATHPTRKLDSPIKADEPAYVVQSVIAGKGPDGAYHSVPLSDTDLLQVEIAQSTHIVEVNSTNIPLPAFGIFTGSWYPTKHCAELVVTAQSNVLGTPTSLRVEWSPDEGTTIFPTQTIGTDVATGRTVTLTIRGAWFRVVYTNGAIAQTSFFLQSLCTVSGSGMATNRLDSGSSTDTFVPYVRSFLAAKLAGGTNFSNLTCSFDGTIYPLHSDIIDRTERLLGKISLVEKVTEIVSVTGAANAAVTATIPPAGLGLYHYITRVEIARSCDSNLAGSGPIVITTTNIPGSLAWTTGSAMDKNKADKTIDQFYTPPLRSLSANTNTTVNCPAPGANVIWRINIFYYIGV